MSRLCRTAAVGLSVALLIGLATYGWRGWYARYFLDDYCTAAQLHDLGFAEAMKDHRASWSGRYSYFVFKAALEAIGPATAKVTPTLMMLLLAIAFVATLRRVVEMRAVLLAAALALTFAMFDASPSMLNTDGTYFWETGYVTYVLPLVLFTWWLGLFVSRRSLAFRCTASAVLMLVAGGLSETSLAAQGALAGGVLMMALVFRNRPAAWIASAGVAATLVALAIVASAPGNAVRAGTYTVERGLGEAAVRALGFANGFVGSYVFLAGAAFLVVIAAGLAVGMMAPGIRPRVAATFAAVAIFAYLMSFYPAAWILPTSPPPASLDVASYFFMLALFAGAVAVGRAKGGFCALMLIVAAVPLWAAVTNVRALPADREKAARMDALDRRLRSSRGQDVIVRERWPVEMRILDRDPSHWANRCVSRYYGLSSVRMR